VSVSDFLKTTKGRIAAGGAGLVVVLLAGWFLLVSPQKSKAKELKAQTETAYTELAQKQAELYRPKAEITVRAKDGYLLGRALPDSLDMAATLLEVEGLARKHRLSFSEITPGDASPSSGYLVHPMDVTLQGRFDQVSGFVGALRKKVRIVNKRLAVDGPIYAISKVDIGTPDAPAEFPVVRAQLTIDTFTYAEPIAPATGETTDQTPSTDATVAAGATR
jgi:hypothetical protein